MVAGTTCPFVPAAVAAVAVYDAWAAVAVGKAL